MVSGGPWNGWGDVIVLLLPLVFLVIAVVKPNPIPTAKCLAAAASMMFLLKLGYLSAEPLETTVQVLRGFLQAMIPTSIVGGAIFLFQAMEAANCLAWVSSQMKKITRGHPVAEVMLIGWAFAYVIEGASGFGTPAALAAPLLHRLGHPKFGCVTCLLCMNTFATVFGAVGTPIWFGLGDVSDDDEVLTNIGFRAEIAVATAAVLLVPLVVKMLVPWADIRSNLLFVELCVLSTVIPALVISSFSYDFPTILGGMIGVLATTVFIKLDVGLLPCSEFAAAKAAEEASVKVQQVEEGQSQHNESTNEHRSIEAHAKEVQGKQEMGSEDVVLPKDVLVEVEKAVDEPLSFSDRSITLGEAALRTLPLWLTVVLLMLTRIEAVGLKENVTSKENKFIKWQLGSLAEFWVSRSLVVGFSDILRTDASWSYALLYVPCLIPFVLAGTVCMLVYRAELRISMIEVAKGTLKRLLSPAIALAGALVLVELIRGGDSERDSPATLIGSHVSDGLSYAFIFCTAAIGALGSFFSGSTTIAILTFADVIKVAAERLDVNTNAMLALQACGATMGNAICLSNIISACTVMGLAVPEGDIIKKTAPFVMYFAVVATAVEGAMILFG